MINVCTGGHGHKWEQILLPSILLDQRSGRIFVKTDRVATENNNADVMTKAVDKNTLQYLKPRVTGYTGHDGTLFQFDPKTATYIPP